MYTPGERNDLSDARYEYWDDGNLGNWWTKIRDKVIKPVARVAAAYYTGGASEAAWKAYDAKEAQKKAIAAQKKQMEEIAKMGNTYPPYPQSLDPSAQRMQAYGAPPSPYPQTNMYPAGYPQQQPAYTQPAPPGVYAGQPVVYNQPQGAPTMTIQPVQQVSHAKLPDWAIPAGVGAVALLLIASQRR